MGKKRSSVRKLPSGEKVRHDPDGREYLVPEDKAGLFLDAISADVEATLAARQQALIEAVDRKRARLEAGNAVPADKRPI